MKLVSAAIALALLTLPASAAPTARSSGTQAVHLGPGSGYGVIDKLRNNERVTVLRCTRQARWCLVGQLDGGPSGWVEGSYLIGSPAKNAVTPFPFNFNPLHPSGIVRR